MTYIEEEEEHLHASESSGKTFEQFLLYMKILDLRYHAWCNFMRL